MKGLKIFKFYNNEFLSESSEICSTKKRKSTKPRSKSVPADRKRVKSTAKTSKRKKTTRPEPEPESEEEAPVEFEDEQTRSPAVSPRKSASQSPASSDYSNGF